MMFVMVATATATAMLFAAFLVVLLYGALAGDRGGRGVPRPCGPVAWRARRRYQARHARPAAAAAAAAGGPRTVTVWPSAAQVPPLPKVTVSWFTPMGRAA